MNINQMKKLINKINSLLDCFNGLSKDGNIKILQLEKSYNNNLYFKLNENNFIINDILFKAYQLAGNIKILKILKQIFIVQNLLRLK